MKLIRHKWISNNNDIWTHEAICKYCGCMRRVDHSTYPYRYIYINSINNIMYRAPECKRIYLGDKVL